MADNHLIRTHEKRGAGFRNNTLLLAFVPLLVAGCAGQPTQLGTFAKSVPSEQAMLLPPPGGPGIVNVIERRYNNAVGQDIYLTTSALTPGQNVFTVQVFGTASPFKMADNNLTSTPVTQAGTSSEMRRALPGIRMTWSAFFVQNNYGPFGYAFGRGAGSDLCMYAWQQVRAPSGTISPFANYGSVQVRLRLCQADATEERLLAVMYNYTITGAVDDAGWNPYGEPQAVSPNLGGVGAPIYPRPASAEPIFPVFPPRQTVVYTRSTPAPAVQRVQTRRVAPSPAQAAPAVPTVTNELRVTVPRPGGGATTAPASTINTPERASAPVVPSPSALGTGQRVNIPPPPCTDNSSGAANACR